MLKILGNFKKYAFCLILVGIVSMAASFWNSARASIRSNGADLQKSNGADLQKSPHASSVISGIKVIDINLQADQALFYLLQNLTSPDVRPGGVMASPSRTSPDYFSHWVRDAATTMNIFVTYLEKGSPSEKVVAFKLLSRWVDFERTLQRLNTMTGLGEPKYNLDGTAFNGPWGRPQTDGPGLRAGVMIRMAKILLARGDVSYVRNQLWCNDCVIVRDLEYLRQSWRVPTFDLWEEVQGDHFYSRMAHFRAFYDGAELAGIMGDVNYKNTLAWLSGLALDELKRHVDHSRNLVLPTINRVAGWDHKQSGLDVAVLLGILHSSHPGELFSVGNAVIHSGVQKLEDKFAASYPLNHSVKIARTAIGRYPEDVYDGNGFSGGNPWFIATNAYAEYYCSLGQVGAGKAFLERSAYHAGRDGRLSEQFNRFNGYMQGARDLTWSYASYLSAYIACTGKLPNLDAILMGKFKTVRIQTNHKK